jgi:uncharacterized membrane protein/uncharacterized protein YciI
MWVGLDRRKGYRTRRSLPRGHRVNANHFVYKLVPPRPTFAGDMSDPEKAVMGEHAAYWTKLFEGGRAVVFGAVLEPSGVWGLAVVEASSVDEVRAIAEDDPAVKTGTCTFDIGAMLRAVPVIWRPVEAVLRRNATEPVESMIRAMNLTSISRASAAARVGVAAAVGLCVGAVVSAPGTWQLGTLLGWDVAAVVFIGTTFATIWRRDATATAHLAVREDPGRAAADALILLASVASLLAVGLVIAAPTASGASNELRAALAVASVVLSWSVVHTVFTARYARLYYTGQPGGIGFNQTRPPRFSDFAYLAFTIGMTYQVSDTELETPEIRATALGHALLSYVFGAGILAAVINLVAGLLR